MHYQHFPHNFEYNSEIENSIITTMAEGEEITKIGPYTIHATVGEGAFSVVRLAQLNNDYFACKIVPRSKLDSDSLLERFKIEIHIFQEMRHPGIVQLVDLYSDKNYYYVFMEYCPNGELFQYIVDRGRLSEEDAKPIIREMLDTIRYVHSMGVTHRDLKPENLLIDSEGHVKLSDFGLSRFLGKNHLVETPCGSPCYASPECLSGKPYDGISTDIWSLGVIIYAMLTGQLPWTKRNQTQLFAQIKRGEYTIPDFLSTEAQTFISGLMTVNIKERMTIEQAINHPFLAGVELSTPATLPLSHYVSLRAVDRFFGNTTVTMITEIEESVNNDKAPLTARRGTFATVIRQLKNTELAKEAKNQENNLSSEYSLPKLGEINQHPPQATVPGSRNGPRKPPTVRKANTRQRSVIPGSSFVKMGRPIVQKPVVRHVQIY